MILWLGIDLYFFQALKTVTPERYIWWAYWLFDGILAAIIIYVMSTYDATASPSRAFYWLLGGMLASLAPKLIVSPVLLLEDLVRGVSYIARWSGHLFHSATKQEVVHLAGRRKLISQLAIGIAAIPFIGLIYGMVKGKYDYRVHRTKLRFKDLPEAFHGFTITQLSDIHSGSFDSKTDVERGIALVNQQKSDLLLFTGDLVNNKAEEMDEWKESFSKLEAAHGKYSVLGNHDYGDYLQWESATAKAGNLVNLKQVHQDIGFRLLLNESLPIEKNGQHITLTGVENWGKGGFHKYGDLDKAMANVHPADFKILMSHDPSHWEAKVLDYDKHVHLTLSGHTHGMQFGIELPGFKWSPIKYLYAQWAGLYKKSNKYIYVNRGFGFLGYPGRVGILPEITVITLEKA
jgi:predicted MPP superfamily phosphohydrolase